MDLKSVLVVHSFRDSSMDARIHGVNKSESLNNIEFSHIALVDYERSGRSRVEKYNELLTSPGQESKALELLTRLVNEAKGPIMEHMERQCPDLMILHQGTALALVPNVVLTLLQNIRDAFPATKVALQGRDDWLEKFRFLTAPTTRTPYPFELPELRHYCWVRDNCTDDRCVNSIVDEIFKRKE